MILAVPALLSGCQNPPDMETPAFPTAKGAPPAINFMYSSSLNSRAIENFLGKKMENTPAAISTSVIDNDQYSERLNLLFKSGEQPDVFEIRQEWLYTYIREGWLTDLFNDSDSSFLAGFPEWALNMGGNGDKKAIYALPASELTVRLLYNKQLFISAGLDPGSPPGTWDALENDARIISARGIGFKQYGFAIPIDDGRLCFSLMEAANTRSGLYYYDFANKKYNLTVYAGWLEMIGRMEEDGSLFPTSDMLKYNQCLDQFALGHIGMILAFSDALQVLGDLQTQVDWGVAMPPTWTGAESAEMQIIPYHFFAVSAESQWPEAAAELWRSLYDKELWASLYESDNCLPVFTGILTNSQKSPETPGYAFHPTEKEAVYPLTPQETDDWGRFDAYINAIHSPQTAADILLKATAALNSR